MRTDIRGKLMTTTVGSFPLTYTTENIHRAVEDQLRAGIDFICVPQLRDMISMFLEPLAKLNCGIEIKGDEYILSSELKKPGELIAHEELLRTLNFLKSSNYASRIRGLKAQITGPLTLAHVVKISGDIYAIRYPDLVLTLSEIIAEIAENYAKYGISMLFIDEPVLPYAVAMGMDEEFLIRALNTCISSVKDKCLTGIHVCGNISGIGKLLLKTEADILDHEFKDMPLNIREYKKTELIKYDKIIGLGCVKTKPENCYVESISEIKDVIYKAIERLGYENILLTPDCGFRGLLDYFKDEDKAEKVAFLKMENMVKAANEVRGEALTG